MQPVVFQLSNSGTLSHALVANLEETTAFAQFSIRLIWLREPLRKAKNKSNIFENSDCSRSFKK